MEGSLTTLQLLLLLLLCESCDITYRSLTFRNIDIYMLDS